MFCLDSESYILAALLFGSDAFRVFLALTYLDTTYKPDISDGFVCSVSFSSALGVYLSPWNFGERLSSR